MAETVVKLDLAQVSPGHAIGAGDRSISNVDGGRHNLGTPVAAGTDFGTGDFTAEGWVFPRTVDTTNFSSIVGNLGSTDTGSWSLYITSSPAQKLRFMVDGVSGGVAASTTLNTNTWYHVAVTRASGTLRIFLDGVLDWKDTGNFGGSIGGTGDLIVGSNNIGLARRFFGRVDELRVTKGVARYDSDDSFLVPSVPYPREEPIVVRTIVADVSTLAVSGQVAAVDYKRQIDPTVASLSVTGLPADLVVSVGADIGAVAGAISLTGQAAVFSQGRRLSATAGTLAAAGQGVQISRLRVIRALMGSCGAIGLPPALSVERRLSPTVASLSVAGQVVPVRVGRRLSATAGTLAAAGQGVQISRASVIRALMGSCGAIGLPPALSVERRLSPSNQIMLAEGLQAALTVGSGVELLAAQGASLVVGWDVGLHIDRPPLLAFRATLLSIGQSAQIGAAYHLAAGQGHLSLTGHPVAVTGSSATAALFASTGSFDLTGQTVRVMAPGHSPDPNWGDVAILISYDTFPFIDEGPQHVVVEDVPGFQVSPTMSLGRPVQTMPALGVAAGAYGIVTLIDLLFWMPVDRRLKGDQPGKFYWEAEIVQGTAADYQGYIGVVSQQQYAEALLSASTPAADLTSRPVFFGSIGYRGTGDTRGNSDVLVGGLETYATNDVVMIAFEPSTGRFWAGVNGVWADDPAADPPTRTSIDAGGDFWPFLHVDRFTFGQGSKLRVALNQLSYPVPAGFDVLGSDVRLDLEHLSVSTIVGPDQLTLSSDPGGHHSLGTPQVAGINFDDKDFTIEGWVFATFAGSGKVRAIMGNNDGGSGWALLITESGNLRLHIVDGPYLTTSSFVSVERWHHFAVSRTDGVIRLFLDGVLGAISSTPYNVWGVGTEDILLGNVPYWSYHPLVGFLDDIRITGNVSRYPSSDPFPVPVEPYPKVDNLVILARSGGLAVTGQVVRLLLLPPLIPAPGEVTVVGQAATVTVARRLSAAAGDAVATGEGTALAVAGELVIASVSGEFAALSDGPLLRVARRLSVGRGSFGLAPSTAVVARGQAIEVTPGSTSVAGPDVALRVSRTLNVVADAVVLGGLAVLRRTRVFVGVIGNLGLSGRNAPLRVVEKLVSAAGALAMTGLAANLLRTRRIAADAAALTVSGAAVERERQRVLAMGAGAVALSGQQGDIRAARTLVSGTVDLSVIGRPVAVPRAYRINVGVATCQVAMPPVSARAQRQLGVGSESVILALQPAALPRTSVVLASPASYAVAGKSSGRDRTRVVTAREASVELVGVPPTLYFGRVTLSHRRRAVLAQSALDRRTGVIVGGAVSGALVRGTVIRPDD